MGSPSTPRPLFRVLRGDDPAERRAWSDLWRQSPGQEPFAHPGYVDAFLEAGQQSRCAVWTSPAGTVLFPLVVRPVANGLIDATTPYGYGGAFAWGDVDSDAFWDVFDEWAQCAGIVTLFARLSVFPASILAFRGETVRVNDNVVRSLDLDDDQLLYDYEHKVRKNINKARRSGVEIEWDLSGNRLDEFHRIYLATMARREAGAGYFFPRSFFRDLSAACPMETAFVHAVVGRRMISTEMVLVGADATYSFLGGTEADSFDLRPNDLLKHEIVRWSRNRGCKWFVLGGGHEPGDGIFRYKRSFAPSGVQPFLVGRRVYNPAECELLVERRRRAQPGWAPSPAFFPPYRGGTAAAQGCAAS